MSRYRVRPATLDDLDALVDHRILLFADRGIDQGEVAAAFRGWLATMLSGDSYKAWVVATETDDIVGGGGISILPWPPGPHYTGGRIAFVYNVYVEPAHRRRGLARRVMEAIHDWCRGDGIGVIALNSSPQGRRLYESMGYQPAVHPMMFAAVEASSEAAGLAKQ